VVPAKVDPIEPAVSWEQLFQNWEFGGEEFRAWANYGTLAHNYGLPALPFGLQIEDEPGGFLVGAGSPETGTGIASDITYTRKDDHFVEIIVTDAENPVMTPPAANLNLNAGQSNQDSFEITIRDRAPFSHWLHYNATGPGLKHEGIPALSNFYYEMGFDPRNKQGLGLLQESGQANSYGFFVSDKTTSEDEDDIADNHAFKKTQTLTLAYPAGSGFADKLIYGGNLLRNAGNFYYFNGAGTEARPDDRFRRFADWTAGLLATDNPAVGAGHFANRAVDADTIFPPADPATLPTNPVFSNTIASADLDMKYAHLRPYYPGTNNFDFPVAPAGRHAISLIDFDEGEDCLATELPTKQEIDECYVETTWEVERDTIIAPFFFNNDYGTTLNIFATGQDARIFGLYQYSTGAQANAQNAYFYRLSGKTHTAFSPTDITAATRAAAITQLQEKIFDPLAGNIGSINVTDITSPSLRVALTDFKTRTTVYYSLSMVSGLDSENADHDLSWSQKVNLYRSRDDRNDSFSTYFKAAAVSVEKRNLNPSNAYRIGEEPPFNYDNFFFQIPEDTRFEVKATMSDNVTAQNLAGSISIGSGTCPFATQDPAAVSGDNRVLPNHSLETINRSPANQYMNMAELRTTHLYPQSGLWDEIVVSATDVNGNSSTLCIPVHVIRQPVLFRQTGQDRFMQ
jgi:hypothetical protein